MLQGIFNIKKLFQDNKSKIRIPLNTLYGSKYLLCVINFALICVVIILSIISASVYFFMPLIDEAKLSKVLDIQEDNAFPDIKLMDIDFPEEEIHTDAKYTIISSKNVFSPQRKEWVVKATAPKSVESTKKILSQKKALSGKPKKIILHGIVIAGNIKKALIKNPMTGVKDKKTVYVNEGEEIEGYMVTSIESDQIRLDWRGEEIIVKLYTGLEGVEHQKEPEEVSRLNRRRERSKDRMRDLHAMEEDIAERYERDKELPEDTFELAPPELLMMEQESEAK